MTPLISVIMPVYNQEKYLIEAIESVLTQTFKDYEFIIYDDGSTDNSASIIKNYAKLDNRIVAFFGENAGRAATTNKISALAKGKWYAFLDADDIMIYNRLEKQIAFHIENPDVDASSCHCYYVNAQGKNQGIQRYPFVKNIEEGRLAIVNNEVICCAITGLMTSQKAYLAIKGLRAQFWPCDDLDFFNRLIENKYIIVIVQDVLMKYRIHTSAASVSNQWHMFHMTRYTKHCIELRRNGKSEISFQEFKHIEHNNSWWIELDIKRSHYGFLFHKKASQAYYSKNYFDFFLLMAAASILSPKFVYAATMNRVRYIV